MIVFACAIGSLGDVNPVISLGSALQQRGHRVFVLTTADAETKVRESGLHAHAVLSQQQWDSWRTLPRESEPHLENMKAWIHMALPAVAETIRFVWQEFVPGDSIGLAPAMTGAGFPFLREKFQMPLIEIQYAPRVHLDAGEFDQMFGDVLNGIRKSIRLPPMQEGWLRWLLTPDRALGLYPEWFLDASDLERPANVIPLHYLFESQDDSRALSEELVDFLARGKAPLVVTFGTYAQTDAALYANAIEACVSIGERLVVLTRYPEQLPSPLPSGCMSVPYVSLKQLFPYASAVIHHGGAGTVAQAFRAGVPQIICPIAFDQFANADRVVALGCGTRIDRAEFRVDLITHVVANTVADAHMTQAAKVVAGRIDDDATSRVCEFIERYARELGVKA
ncbi:glycosyltransferase [Tahibacter sp.]|uniref:glycosyltransferase n=1 Tax=Tahibacter sp. TaxID=2056211 RepID=UPI0028C4FEE3|nr:glycosyltransferase [Tahibacter sp.]